MNLEYGITDIYNSYVNNVLKLADDAIANNKNALVVLIKIPLLVDIDSVESTDFYEYTKEVIHEACDKLKRRDDQYCSFISFDMKDDEFVVYLSKYMAFTDAIGELYMFKKEMDSTAFNTIINLFLNKKQFSNNQ